MVSEPIQPVFFWSRHGSERHRTVFLSKFSGDAGEKLVAFQIVFSTLHMALTLQSLHRQKRNRSSFGGKDRMNVISAVGDGRTIPQ